MVFPTFFNLSLNFAIRSSWSNPQSAPSLVFADWIERLYLWLQRYNQSDFSIDHLVMSMCWVFSCVVGRRCLLWPVHFLGTIILCPALFCIQMGMSFLISLPFTSLLFSAIYKASSDNHFAFLHFFFLGMVFASCTMLWTSVHSPLGTLSIESNPLNLFVTSTV